MESFPAQLGGRVTIANRSGEARTVTFPDGCVALLRAYRPGGSEAVWDQSAGHAHDHAIDAAQHRTSFDASPDAAEHPSDRPIRPLALGDVALEPLIGSRELTCAFLGALLLGIHPHGAEFVHAKRLAMPTRPELSEHDRSRRRQLDCRSHDGEERRQGDQQGARDNKVEDPLTDPSKGPSLGGCHVD